MELFKTAPFHSNTGLLQDHNFVQLSPGRDFRPSKPCRWGWPWSHWCLCWDRVHPGEFVPLTFSSTLCYQFRAAVWVLESTPGSPVQMTWFSLKLEDADLLNAFRKQTVLSEYTQFISLQCTSLRNVGFLPWLKTGLMRRNICQSGDSVVLAMWQASQQRNKIQQLKLGRTLGIKVIYL